MSDKILLLLRFIEIPVFNVNSVNPDFAASDLGLHCLPISLLGVSRLKWVNLYRHVQGPPRGGNSFRFLIDFISEGK